MIRRATAAALCAVLALAPGLHAGDLPIKNEQWALASIVVPSSASGDMRWYGAFLLQKTDVVTGDVDTLGGIFKGSCVKQKDRRGTSLSCRGSGPGFDESDEFTMRPDASHALLRQRARGQMNRVRWTALEGAPGTFGSAEVCASGQGEGAGIVREAVSSARIFGDRVVSDPHSFWDWSVLAQGVMVTQCGLGFSAAELADVRDGGSFDLTLRF